ncbi:MAG TPA: uracil-DNA glycosylase [Maritimibacter sp.]|nr:uracil-DNA glycosylase [Maritimibacter sp.]
MESALDWHQAKALLDWYVELGVTDAISEEPIDRYELPAEAPKMAAPARSHPPDPTTPPPVVEVPQTDWVAEAKSLAAQAETLETLAEAVEAFEGAEIKKGARRFVFSDGNPAARVMVIGEGPGEQEDREGRPFVGPAGQLLDRMFDAIGMGRALPDADHALYISNVVPWRPPGNREPSPEEIAMFRPFLLRHIELAAPDVVVAMGNTPCRALIPNPKGITRQRGIWTEVADRPLLPMFHPSYLLRSPIAKREAWADLLSLQAKLREMSP